MAEVLQLRAGASLAQQIRDVFDHWRTTLGHDRARLDAHRSRTVRAMLEAGYTVDDLKLAIDGCATSEWHRGKNDRGTPYDGLGLILRDAEHVDRFMALAEKASQRAQARAAEQDRRTAPPAPKRPMPEAARQQVQAYLGRGKGEKGPQ